MEEKQNKMAVQPVGPLMLRIGIPIVLSMILQAAYNVVDSAYLARMAAGGEEALTALSLAFPVQLFMVAVSVGTGVGTNALLAKSLGQGSRDKVGAAVLAQAGDYLRICCCIPFGIVFFSVYEKILQATGRSLYSTIAQISGAVINIVVDPVLIYGWFGLPAMGVRGAAWATVIGQLASAALAFGFHLKLDVEVDNQLRYLRPRRSVILSIYAIGLPAIIAQALLTVMTYCLNLILGAMPAVGENAVTVYGLYYKIQQLIIFAAFGVRDAITPIVSFNYGMRSKTRVQQGIRWGLIYTTVLMAVGTLSVELFAEPLAGLFSLSGTTHTMCVACMRTVSLGFVFAGLCIALQGVFQALECGIESLVISLCRQVIFVLPVVWWLTRTVTGPENVNIVWWPLMLCEVLTCAAAIILFRRAARTKINTLEG